MLAFVMMKVFPQVDFSHTEEDDFSWMLRMIKDGHSWPAGYDVRVMMFGHSRALVASTPWEPSRHTIYEGELNYISNHSTYPFIIRKG